MEPAMLDADPKLSEYYRRFATQFIAMLAGWRDDIEFREPHSPTISKINAKRKLARQSPIFSTKTIHITSQRIQYLRDRAHAGPRGVGRGGTHASPHEHLRTICAREIVYMRNGKEVRYHFKKAGQKVEVKPRMAANSNQPDYGLAPVYQIVR